MFLIDPSAEVKPFAGIFVSNDSETDI